MKAAASKAVSASSRPIMGATPLAAQIGGKLERHAFGKRGGDHGARALVVLAALA